MHTVTALLCFVVVIHWLIFPYPSGLLHWHCGNLTIAPVPAKQPWWIWINTSCEFIMNDCITTTKQSTTNPCAYFLGYTVQQTVIETFFISPDTDNEISKIISTFNESASGRDNHTPAIIKVIKQYINQYINSVQIERVNGIKFHGVKFDPQLTRKPDIDHIRQKMSQNIGIISKTLKKLHLPQLLMYYSFIYPYLNYCKQV